MPGCLRMEHKSASTQFTPYPINSSLRHPIILAGWSQPFLRLRRIIKLLSPRTVSTLDLSFPYVFGLPDFHLYSNRKIQDSSTTARVLETYVTPLSRSPRQSNVRYHRSCGPFSPGETGRWSKTGCLVWG